MPSSVWEYNEFELGGKKNRYHNVALCMLLRIRSHAPTPLRGKPSTVMGIKPQWGPHQLAELNYPELNCSILIRIQGNTSNSASK